VGAQLEACLGLLVDRTKLAKAQEFKIVSLETEIFSLKSSLDSQTSELRDKEVELITSQLQTLVKKPVASDFIKDSFAREREELIRLAEETVNSLKRQLLKKEEALEKYRNMILELRQEIAKQKEAEALEASKRTCEINNQADKSLNTARRKPEIITVNNAVKE
jgi:hypothetical protein